jgi:hypothetical protein
MILHQRNAVMSSIACRIVCSLLGIFFCWSAVQAAQSDITTTHTGIQDVGMDWGGHLRGAGTITFIDDDSIYQYVDTGSYVDGQIELRLKNRLYLDSCWELQTHYELVALGGDTYENNQALEQRFPALTNKGLFVPQTIDDDSRLFDLARQLDEEDRYQVYHRLDRLHLTYAADWGTLRIGRQALSWGDGMVFHPMDLFNPFAPVTVQRDYKAGDDMAHLQFPINTADMEVLYLPRRDIESGNVQHDASSYALKYHTPAGPLEMDFMAAWHYDEGVVGMGGSGYMGNAVWRINTTYTHLSEEKQKEGFFQLVANADYAWMWGGKNVYGLVEFFYNGLGRTRHYDNVVTDKDLVERLGRGELYTIGQYYLAGQVQIELHPLVQMHTTAIVNAGDPSGVLQPQTSWDITGDLQLIFGALWNWGGDGSEYGGYDITAMGSPIRIAPADRIYFWLTYYF